MTARTRLSPRLLAIVAPISTLGIAAYIAATVSYLAAPGPLATSGGVVALVAAATFAERYPVPVEGADANGVSLGFVFAVAALVLFGWAAGTFVYVSGFLIVALVERKPAIRTLFNAGVYGVLGTLAGIVLSYIHGGDVDAVVAQVGVTALLVSVVNIVLVTAAIAASGSELGYLRLIRWNIRSTAMPFALMGSATLILVVLWQRTPLLGVALIGPLAAISLYQRSTHHALAAMRLALTDPLTGLGNHRHFHERLQRELASAEEHDGCVSLCLLDIDDFKQINDRHGHPAGDLVLSEVAGRLRQGGQSFRLGGDEFAILLPGTTDLQALDVSRSIVARIDELELGHVGAITISAGVATFPQLGTDRDSLIRLADGALYWAKEHGKNQVRLAQPDAWDLSELRRLPAGADTAARFRAAGTLARSVDARDAYIGSHCDRVASLAVQLAERMSLPAADVELARLAGSLHDLGKLAIPEEILRKPGVLTEAERLVLERHPQLGFRMLENLGLELVADWVLHHHERWDGTGYPDGIAGDEIPLGARILSVAEAFDAMTSDRTYGPTSSRREPLREVEACAGSQFDPEVVAALLGAVGASEPVGVQEPIGV